MNCCVQRLWGRTLARSILSLKNVSKVSVRGQVTQPGSVLCPAPSVQLMPQDCRMEGEHRRWKVQGFTLWSLCHGIGAAALLGFALFDPEMGQLRGILKLFYQLCWGCGAVGRLESGLDGGWELTPRLVPPIHDLLRSWQVPSWWSQCRRGAGKLETTSPYPVSPGAPGRTQQEEPWCLCRGNSGCGPGGTGASS